MRYRYITVNRYDVCLGKDVSTHLQFEDRLGLIFPLGAEGNHHISVRYLHYSNA
ncbi:acyloxyacyl hydrolase [Alteromonas gracilis]|uniref:acyloxyacyl hydrolase n=1 Tax=Alteromonas gracilis TaxID=1479524 RepID=UPI003D6612A7